MINDVRKLKISLIFPSFKATLQILWNKEHSGLEICIQLIGNQWLPIASNWFGFVFLQKVGLACFFTLTSYWFDFDFDFLLIRLRLRIRLRLLIDSTSTSTSCNFNFDFGALRGIFRIKVPSGPLWRSSRTNRIIFQKTSRVPETPSNITWKIFIFSFFSWFYEFVLVTSTLILEHLEVFSE